MLGCFISQRTSFLFISVFPGFSFPRTRPFQVRFLHPSSSMAPKKTVPEKRKMKGSSSCAPPPPLDNPEKFITREAKKLYHESLYNRTVVAKRGIPNLNVYFGFMIQERGWTIFCAHPQLRIGPVVREFHSNLRFRVGTTICVRGKWVDFSATAINRVYNLVDDDSKAYRALFQDTDYKMIMRFLTRGRGVWKRHPSTSEVTTFQMKALKPVPKVWYNFICATLKPSLHLSIVTWDKTILLYAIVQGNKFDVGNVIERGIIKST